MKHLHVSEIHIELSLWSRHTKMSVCILYIVYNAVIIAPATKNSNLYQNLGRLASRVWHRNVWYAM